MSDRILASILKLMSRSADTGSANDASVSLPWVLHVEDDAEFSAAVKIRLEAHGIVVVRAFDGMDGVRSAFKYPADAIILDIEMPNGNGFDVLRLLKENPITKAIPTIVLSGRSERTCKQRMLDIGADCYLTKPLDFSILHEKLAQYVDVLPLGTK